MNNPSPLACGLDLESFKPSTITLVEGPSRFEPDLLLYLCAHTANRLLQDVVFVDGGNSFNPPNKKERLLALPLLRTGLATLPNKKERLLALPLLRTGLATLITSGSSLS